MDRKERALELARQQYADGGGPRYTPRYTEHGALIEPSMRDRANMVRDAFDSVAGHPFVRVAREYPREMAQEIGSSVVSGIKAAPSAAKNLAVNTARYVYNNPSAAAGNALEFAAGMSPSPVAMFFWGPGGMLSPSSAKAPELDPEIAMRHAQAQEARLMQDENYAGGYAEGGEVREGYSNGRVVKPLLEAGESFLTKLAKEALQRRGSQAAMRVERAADEIPNLEYQYTPDALRNALLSDDSLVATIKPGEFQNFAHRLTDASENFYMLPANPNKPVSREEYIKHLSQFPVAGGGGFSDVPFLVYGKKAAGTPAIVGHEGRHRMLALEELEEPSSLVRILPEYRVKDELKDRLTANNPGRNVYINDLLNTAFKSKIQHSGPVVGEGRSLDKFNMLEMPEVYERGGEVREAHSNGKRVVGPLATAAESAMTKAAEKILAEKMAERAARYVADPEQRAANLSKWQAQTPAQITEPTWYHGTFTDVENLRPGRADATFVTTNPEFANRFATPADKGPSADWDAVNKVWVSRESLPSAPNVMPLHVRAENPFDYENPAHVEAVMNAVRNSAAKDDTFHPAHVEMIAHSLPKGDWLTIEQGPVQKAIRDLGHDAFYVTENGAKNLGLYDPTRQLKSATGNLGTFDPNIPRLTEAKGGTVVDRAIMLASKKA